MLASAVARVKLGRRDVCRAPGSGDVALILQVPISRQSVTGQISCHRIAAG